MKEMEKMKILYVDDEFINLRLFEINLGGKYHVFTADSAMNGLQILEENSEIQLVVSDMKMPQMNGIEFIKIAKEKYPTKTYCMITGYDVTTEIQNALNEGLILNYFRKPFNMDELEKEFEKLI